MNLKNTVKKMNNHFDKEIDLIGEEIKESFSDVLNSGWYILGNKVKEFEMSFSNYLGCKFSVGVASGTEAITLGLLAYDIGSGDEVITTNVTAFPTITGIIQSGASPIVVDINIEDGLIDIEKIEENISSKTRAIVPVHLYGQCCDMDVINKIASKHNLIVLEDAAQAAGSLYKEKYAGTLSNCAAFSFYPTKNLGAYGDAGAVVTNDKFIYEKLLRLRNYGQSDRYHHDYNGLNSRLDEVQAAILLIKLKYLDQWNLNRRKIAEYYKSSLKYVEFLKEHSYNKNNYHLFVIKSEGRDLIKNKLKEYGIETLIHYPIPINNQKAFFPRTNNYYPNSEIFCNSILSLPISPFMEEKTLNEIIKIINNIYE